MRPLVIILMLTILACQTKVETRKLPIIGPIDFDETSDTIYHQIKPFELYSQSGDTITLDSLKGKVHVAEFFFSSCPVICPIMKSRMKMVYDKFYNHKDFRITSYTVDPERDNITALNTYGEELGIDPSIWYLMTGDAYDIQKVSYHSYIQANVKDSLSLNHSQQFVLIGKDLHIRGLYDGTDSLSVTMLMEDVELLLNE